MKEQYRLKCHLHPKNFIKRVTFNENSNIKCKLMCDECDSYSENIMLYNSFINIFQKYRPTLENVSSRKLLLNINKQVQQLLSQIKQFSSYLERCILINFNQKPSVQYYNQVLNNIIWPYVAKTESSIKNGDKQQQNQALVKILQTKRAIDQTCQKLLKNFTNCITNLIQQFKKSLQNLKTKNFTQIGEMNINTFQNVQKSYKRQYQTMEEQNYINEPRKIIKNTDNQKESLKNLNTKTSQQKNKNIQHLKNQLQATVTLPKQILIPLNSQFQLNSIVTKGIQPHIISYKSSQNVGFTIASPSFSQQFNSRIFKIVKFNKGSQIYIGAAIKNKVQQKKYINCFGYSQGTFLIKGSSSLSNITFFSHQFQRSMQLKNYSIQQGYFVQVKLNIQKSALDFSILKPMYRHLGTMMIKNIKPQNLCPVIGIKGDASVKIIQKQIVTNIQDN